MKYDRRMAPVAIFLIAATAATVAQQTAAWLDRPLVNWNQPGAAIPKPPANEESKQELIVRCKLTPPVTTAGEKALDAAGWIPFWNVAQQLVRDDVEIIGGMAASDGMCRPASYNLFVFVGNRFAGVLSPTLMTSRFDGSTGAVRLRPPEISAEFARYAAGDPLCCPSSRVTVRFRIDRRTEGTVVVAEEVRTTRP
jgi:hypothetical protein